MRLRLAIAVSDFRHFIVPDALSASAFVLGLVFAGLFDDAPLAEAILTCLLRAAASALPLLALMLFYEWWRGRPGLGLGDVKLAGSLGALTAATSWSGLLLAVLILPLTVPVLIFGVAASNAAIAPRR